MTAKANLLPTKLGNADRRLLHTAVLTGIADAARVPSKGVETGGGEPSCLRNPRA